MSPWACLGSVIPFAFLPFFSVPRPGTLHFPLSFWIPMIDSGNRPPPSERTLGTDPCPPPLTPASKANSHVLKGCFDADWRESVLP